MKKSLLAVMAATTLLISCHSTRKATLSAPVVATPPIAEKTPAWAPKKHDYNPSRTRAFDLLDTRLDVRFDWEKQWLMGKANLKLRPFCYPESLLVLDAKGFQVNEVALVQNGNRTGLKFENTGEQLRISLPSSFNRTQELEVYIDYIAKPNERKAQGSAAITEAKGLYFINPDGKNPYKPKQIWTQGETESSSAWFPTIDAPNERCTQEMFITVEDKYVTLSNGLMLDSKKNGDGTRTDHWKMSLPHAPYLFMMAVGEFSVTKETWRGKEVSYYVEPKYGPYAKTVFGNTPEMLEFYSTRMGVEYPWEKFSQVVVRDFVSGAMENTSAVVHFGGLQQNNREHLDAPMEDIVAHELFHHWFGDLVTCESWANLPLNESFATYGEYLWSEHKYGRDAADDVFSQKLSQYLGESQRKREPLIRYQHGDREEMFDAHSYQKGGCVLHMLRNVVGDEAFFRSLELYLKRNAYSDVEIDELRLAFEDVCGTDLNWFFNQWFLSPGHPELRVKSKWENGVVTMNVKQVQDVRYMPVYRLPLKIRIAGMDADKTWDVTISSQDTTLTFDFGPEPRAILFDEDKILLADVREEKSVEEWTWILSHVDLFRWKEEALTKLGFYIDRQPVLDAVIALLNHPYEGLRQSALYTLQIYDGPRAEEIRGEGRAMATTDKKAGVRAEAMMLGMPREWLKKTPEDKNTAEYNAVMEMIRAGLRDSSYRVASLALQYLYALDKPAGAEQARIMKQDCGGALSPVVVEILLNEKQSDAMPFIRNQIASLDGGMEKFGLISKLSSAVEKSEGDIRNEGIATLEEVAEFDGTWWIRLVAVQSLLKFTSDAGVKDFLRRLNEKETQENIKSVLEQQIKTWQ